MDVVIMFELTLNNGGSLKYSDAESEDLGRYGDEFFEVRIRYKNPDESHSSQITVPVKADKRLGINTTDYNFTSSVAALGHLFRNSLYSGDVTLDEIMGGAGADTGMDNSRLRSEFFTLLNEYRDIRR